MEDKKRRSRPERRKRVSPRGQNGAADCHPFPAVGKGKEDKKSPFKCLFSVLLLLRVLCRSWIKFAADVASRNILILHRKRERERELPFEVSERTLRHKVKANV
jgi:hypothetical protein